MSKEIKEELQDYLNQKNINALFVSIVESILVDKPDNVIGFITNYLVDKYPEETKDLAVLKQQNKPPSLIVAAAKDALEEMTDSDCSSVDTNESVAISVKSESSSENKPPQRKKRRESVCAEKIADSKVQDSQLKIVEKSATEATRILQILSSNVFFGHLDEQQMKTIQDAMFSVDKDDGDVIIQQGDTGDNFYIIDIGIVEVFIDSSDGERNLVKTCEAGDSFGELAIMYNAPRAASCVSKGDVRLWALDRVSFNIILQKTTIAKRKLRTDTLLKIPVFSQLNEYELLTIADTLQEETFADQSVICNQAEE